MTVNLGINLFAFLALTLLWVGFAGALLFHPGTLDAVWQSFRGLPVFLQVIIGLLVLPIVLGLWIWESPWPTWLRLVLVIGLGAATIYTFFPRQS